LPLIDQTCDPETTYYPFDLAKAADVLTEAGWVDTDGDGIRDNGKTGDEQIELRLVFQTSANTVRQRTQEIIRDSLKEIGVEVKIEVIDASLFSQVGGPVENFYADLMALATSTPNPDSAANMGRWLCNTIPDPTNNWRGRNFERFCDGDYDDLYESARTLIAPAARTEVFVEMNRTIVEQVVTIPMIHRGDVSAVGNNIEGVDLTPWDSEFWNVQMWRRNHDGS
jgi:peptide/nickel transport system substrate-binding protein